MQRAYIDNNDLVVFDTFLDNFEALGNERIMAEDSLDRVTYEAVFARKCDPMYNAAAMDGIVVVANDTIGASDQSPLTLTLNEDFEFINTGNAIPSKFDSVIMIEDVLIIDDKHIQIIRPSFPWQHIRVKGESIAQGEMVLPSKHTIRPQDISAILASGNSHVFVYKNPKLGIIPTGNEMVTKVEDLVDGKLMESNSHMFSALAHEIGAIAKRYPIVEDDKELLEKSILKAVSENDVVIVNAGSSAGTKDYTREVLEKLGSVFAHGFAIKPGKPTILAIVKGKAVIGVPGYPVSANLVFTLFVKRLLLKLASRKEKDEIIMQATLTKNIVSSFKNTDIVRVTLGYVYGTLVASPMSGGAAKIMNLVNSDGVIVVPRNSEGYAAGSLVDVKINKSWNEIVNRVVIIGSHDLVIDLIGDTLPIVSAHVGSMGGIMSLIKNECHIAPIHLLDEETGEYNIPYIKKYFPGKKMALITGVGRTQGLIIAKSNPKKIKGIADVERKDISYANRQRGAGTRLLFDYELKKLGIGSEKVHGYEKEFNTHLAVGVAVENGIADVGMGIKSVAMNMGLDFIPIANESYAFLTTADRLEDERIKNFIEVLKSDTLIERIKSLGDYTVENIGEVKIIDC